MEDILFWFEKDPETVKNQEEFMDAVLRKHARCHAGSGGVQLGRYIVDIKNGKVKEKFLNAIEKMLKSQETENWIKEELEFTKRVAKTWKSRKKEEKMAKRKKPVNLDAVVTFYDPHPGFGGAAIPLPGPVKKVIDELNGKKMTLREGIEKIKATKIGKLEIWDDDGCIVLGLGEWPPKKYPYHTWMLIKYKPKQKRRQS